MAIDTERLLQDRAAATTELYADPHNPSRHLTRARIHERLGFPDLASADAYRALSLLDSVVDPDGCEFHARKKVTPAPTPTPAKVPEEDEQVEEEEDEDENDGFEPITEEEYRSMIGDTYCLLVNGLKQCGCLRDAYEFAHRGRVVLDELLTDGKEIEGLQVLKQELTNLTLEIGRESRMSNGAGKGQGLADDCGEFNDKTRLDPSKLKAQGFARRILYPWNEHEPNRKSPETLRLLNERLRDIAPKCEVRAVALPVLHETTTANKNKEKEDEGEQEEEEVSIQLGLFAKEDLAPGETILHESSLLTATNRLHDDTCDACNGPLPPLSSENPPVACAECYDIIFCSQTCHDQAQVTYHGAVCGLMENLESIGKDIPDPKDKADYLYLLLLGRALAMAQTQEVNPLDLDEVKYIWGDFVPYVTSELVSSPPAKQQNLKSDSVEEQTKRHRQRLETLPFSFHLSILQPMRIVEEMGLDPYATLHRYDTWILNTLYAKFRGTASGRLSTWDGGPETCAVHPLWCLANHSCDPNVRWEWGGEIAFVVRGDEERVVWKRQGEEREKAKGGIRKDEEILNHYCDVELNVKERREWAAGALGGMCLCKSSIWYE
ncbi:hypothetical protein AN0288.2 [Aspergillus nidulans FGSC A4]|uniref:MYND domain protein, putative (AFU_orthologue AFUA_1G03000) n=1 Tax=Emericella nidulans (strain FGSC A4 / ATCC 38163 / CBS 112.46 / NRRL 194 / M139) TaxID=227321 RepID=Q5BGP2_EMENI|nr:hypothetical protein [Aspergillus nidulans FGSC A4]EAA66161.1 hypothetical protein AN0288.2 [Aspergillus nidulans FGSC A4]CBF89804.1 TPA: MYND domain protein, putative (AFU_orthologue; AFUA_1G03000) [Aspergillus nidulans FGSC A4]|eukprot:XP_657892.1 hypothetical protein AN0288.2 [Aspergillus nidulans FGSC A4]